jgi:SAM-dependent methyltransferase
MDELARYNQERWEELARNDVMYSRPWLDLTAGTARQRVDPEGKMDDPAGKDVLLLAGGGGQQSAAFALLGARVTVLDLCETQLDRDREAAKHYGTAVTTVQGDMRDLTCFAPGSFDLVWHAHSLTFVPEARTVFEQVARVLRPGGQYRLHWSNPFSQGAHEEGWAGRGYLITRPYGDGETASADSHWDIDQSDGRKVRVRGPREFRHTLGTVVNGLIGCGFAIEGLWEDDRGDRDAEPGSWAHFKSFLPPWITAWGRKDETGGRHR